MKANERLVLAAIDGYRRTNGYAPTMRELMPLTGLQSVSSVSYWLWKLERAGLVSTVPSKTRTLRITSSGYDALTDGRVATEAQKRGARL